MNAKELLEQPTVLNEKINIDFLHRQKLKELLEQISGGSVALHERVQGGQLPDSPATKLTDKIADLDRLIEQELAEYDTVMEQIKEVIASCKNQDEMKVLKKKYLEGKNIPDIALDLNVSESTAYTLHNRAIKQVNVFLGN
ncbi:MAG: DUF1492 domain-containing protein [Lachnospiraceae bacterium]